VQLIILLIIQLINLLFHKDVTCKSSCYDRQGRQGHVTTDRADRACDKVAEKGKWSAKPTNATTVIYNSAKPGPGSRRTHLALSTKKLCNLSFYFHTKM